MVRGVVGDEVVVLVVGLAVVGVGDVVVGDEVGVVVLLVVVDLLGL